MVRDDEAAADHRAAAAPMHASYSYLITERGRSMVDSSVAATRTDPPMGVLPVALIPGM